jgi:hypothetical protein
MTYTIRPSTIHTIRPGDQHFQIHDGLTIASRAGFEISRRCPENYQDLIQECIRHGWLKPVAYITEREMIFLGLTNDN